MTAVFLVFRSLRGTYTISYDPRRPVAFDMHLGETRIRCDVFIDEDRPGCGHVVCGIAVFGPGYWFELHLDHPTKIEFYGNGVLDHVAEPAS